MIVRSLRLYNFRNYVTQEIELPSGLIALTGDNGQGKTNLLEALCVLATTKSPLVERDRELIRWHEKEARIAAEVELAARRGERRMLEYGWRMEGVSVAREMRAGGVPQSAIVQWLGQLQVVAFFPHDLVLITGEPGERRRFLNLELGKTRPAHFADAARYRRALQQRNALLRSLMESRFNRHRTAPLGAAVEGLGTLSEWNRQLITYGSRILAQRAQFLTELQPLLQEAYGKLSGRDDVFSVEYLPGIKTGKQALGAEEAAHVSWSQLFSVSLEGDHDHDMRRGTTQSGPHRDDLVFKLGTMDLRRYGSQGQQRLAVLALKVALAHWVARVTQEPPILLLDDALSELDATRRTRLLEEAACFPQSVLTATDAKFLQGVPATLFSVSNGCIAGGAGTEIEQNMDNSATMVEQL
ncbi:MAG: DNA replication/repair protein RecF [Abitibacteriaceae bacterium]|nr:DNA replication/repair protein RecF [Abditibacteriaceae bacterium]